MTGAFDGIVQGTVIDYPYLFPEDAGRGREAGKDRPSAVVVRAPGPTGDLVFLLALSTTPPRAGQAAYELPETEVRRLGTAKRVWVRLDSYNLDVIGRSYHLDPNAVRGRLSGPVLREVATAFRRTYTRLKRVDRG